MSNFCERFFLTFGGLVVIIGGKGGIMEKQLFSVQDWLPIDMVFDNGVFRLKGNRFLKVIKVNPINFNLKSNLEKESILNSYKILLKTCNFDFQILVQSSKRNLNENIKFIQDNVNKENKDFLSELADDYIDFIQKINSIKNSSIKNFYIIIANTGDDPIDLVFQDLNEKYFKIKECLFRCGNTVEDLDSKEEIKNLFKVFLNSRIYLR